mgnify:CR=1 FL=1
MKNLYQVDLFEEKGFTRKQCPLCKDYFWTLNPDQVTCGEPPCTEYTFIGSPPTSKYKSLASIRSAYIKFFEKRGHSHVKRYPVVARWRDDVYLVGASIYCFQPWVTEGIVDPPANPLVISQPCIRLTDLDNIGRTGRHLSCFEMMAHHAFNFGKITVYWNNETVRLCFDFFTEELKIPEDKIVFKEGMWSGGGNAGEDFEVLIEGLEVATLVFMHYRQENSKLLELGNYIVDTGYGLERILWLSTGAPTLYDALFADILPEARKMLGIPEPDPSIMSTLSKYFGKIDASKTDIEKSYREIASLVGMSTEELKSTVIPLENIYAVLDHCRALMFMIGDGVVPSNTGTGYLARLLIRRAVRKLRALSPDVSLVDIMSLSLKYWTNIFIEYKDLVDTILEIVDLEEERYNKTLKKGEALVKSFIRKKLEKKEKVRTDDLIYLYESHGVPPDLVEKIAKKIGAEVKVPQNFYELLAQKASFRKIEKEEKIPLDQKLLEGESETIPLYYKDPYLFKFTAKVLKIINGKYVILDRTAFYPEGGGQPSDRGFLINKHGERIRVNYVFKVGNIVVHEISPKDSTKLKEGELIEGHVDEQRRKQLMKAHTATHILLGALRRVLGPHVWQAGAQKGVNRSRLDITHYKHLSLDELHKVEMLANKIIQENRKVHVSIEERTKAEQKYGFVLYQGGVVPGKTLRVVNIEDWDVEACGGTHCRYTGEVGFIKIIRSLRIQDGVERIEFTVGEKAVEYVQKMERSLKEIADTLGTPVEDVVHSVAKIYEEYRELRRENERLKEKILEMSKDKVLEKGTVLGEFFVIVHEIEAAEFRDLLKLATLIVKEKPNAVTLLYSRRNSDAVYLILLGKTASKKIDARELGQEIMVIAEGKGGGKIDMFNGKGQYLPEHMLRNKIVEKIKTLTNVNKG